VIRAAGHVQDQDDPVTPTEIYYDPADVADSVTLYFHADNALHIVTGARGSLTITSAKRQYGVMRFEFTGLVTPPAAGAMPTIDTSAFVKPLPFRAANVEFGLLGQSNVPLHSLTLNGGQEVGFYETSEEEAIEQQDRVSNFQALIEHPDLATWNIFQDIENSTIGALSFALGTAPGNIFEIAAGEVQITNPPTRSNENGITALQIGGPIIASDTSANPTGYRITVK